MKASFRYRPWERLRTSQEYQRVKKEGHRVRTAHFVLNYARNNLLYHRLGLVVQKRFWNAVLRNRIKRCLRAWFRLYKPQIPPPGKDIVIIARPGAELLTVRQIAAELAPLSAKEDHCKS